MSPYRTRDLGLAAYLLMCGEPEPETVEIDGDVWFVFRAHARVLKRGYFGSDFGPYYAAIKRARKMVRERLDE